MQTSRTELVDLLGLVARGDKRAFAHVYRAVAPKLYGIVLRILGRRDVADEVLQEVFVKIWERAGDFRADLASPITWMATIARNRALDEVRRKQPQALEETPEALQVADPAMLASDKLELSEEFRRLERCLAALDDEKQAMVKLAYLNGLSREQLAGQFGKPVATIKTWLHRSLKQLKDCLS